VRDDRRWTARALARRLASSTIALPVAALPRGATPPIRASRGQEGSRAAPSALRADGRGAWKRKGEERRRAEPRSSTRCPVRRGGSRRAPAGRWR
jgi:hypothetical protein